MIKSPGIESTLSKLGDFMQPKSGISEQGDLFRSRLDQILNRRHPLYRLADSIDWSVFDREFGPLYVDNIGRPGLPIRLLVGLHYLKHAFNVSDETVVDQFIENGYWQYFCGFEYFQHEFSLDPTTLVKWRKRIGPKGMEKLLKATVETAKSKEYVTEKHLERVNVDTTVQEKAIAFPTDARLYHKARRILVKLAKRQGIDLRQTYERLGKKALIMQGRYSMLDRRGGPDANRSGCGFTWAGSFVISSANVRSPTNSWPPCWNVPAASSPRSAMTATSSTACKPPR